MSKADNWISFLRINKVLLYCIASIFLRAAPTFPPSRRHYHGLHWIVPPFSPPSTGYSLSLASSTLDCSLCPCSYSILFLLLTFIIYLGLFLQDTVPAHHRYHYLAWIVLTEYCSCSLPSLSSSTLDCYPPPSTHTHTYTHTHTRTNIPNSTHSLRCSAFKPCRWASHVKRGHVKETSRHWRKTSATGWPAPNLRLIPDRHLGFCLHLSTLPVWDFSTVTSMVSRFVSVLSETTLSLL